eukprot:6166424-Pyramimonas_sp.AAC.1
MDAYESGQQQRGGGATPASGVHTPLSTTLSAAISAASTAVFIPMGRGKTICVGGFKYDASDKL